MNTGNIVREIKRNLLGGLEIALFMPAGRARFGETKGEALRSFAVPVIFFPVTLLAVYLYPPAQISESDHAIALLYSLRMAVVWAAYFGTVYFIVSGVDRKKYFYQFVIASNWLTVPATVVFLPVIAMMLSGAYSGEQIYVFMLCLMAYTYAFTGFMAAYVLRIPWELAGFIAIVCMSINDSTLDFLTWVGGWL